MYVWLWENVLLYYSEQYDFWVLSWYVDIYVVLCDDVTFFSKMGVLVDLFAWGLNVYYMMLFLVMDVLE